MTREATCADVCFGIGNARVSGQIDDGRVTTRSSFSDDATWRSFAAVRRSGCVETRLKSFAVRGFPMMSTMRELNSLVSSEQLSTPTGPLSTQAGARFQLRDLFFISTCSASSYLTTGVESRSSVAFAPTIPSRTRAPRANRRIEKLRPVAVSHLS
jgi:hypothetical protein